MTGLASEPVLVDTAPGHLLVRLNRPHRRNVIDRALLESLLGAVDAAERAGLPVVLAAEGTDFCAGMDLGADPVPPSAGELPYWTLLRRLAEGPVPSIAVVDGPATGGGVGLAAACDLVLAGTSARFRLTEVLLGLVPAMALPFVARRVGEPKAFQLSLTATELDAAAAERIGLADRIGGHARRELLRPELASLHRAAPAALRALKEYRARLYPLPDRELAVDALRERIADPETTRRLAALRAEGLLQ